MWQLFSLPIVLCFYPWWIVIGLTLTTARTATIAGTSEGHIIISRYTATAWALLSVLNWYDVLVHILIRDWVESLRIDCLVWYRDLTSLHKCLFISILDRWNHHIFRRISVNLSDLWRAIEYTHWIIRVLLWVFWFVKEIILGMLWYSGTTCCIANLLTYF